MKNKIKSNLKNKKGAVSLLVAITIFTFIAILMGGYLTIMILRQSQYESNSRIQQIYGKDVDRVDEIYAELEEYINSKPVAAPEKSEESSFDRTYGVIEVEFLNGTSYEIADKPNAPKVASDMKKVYWEEVEAEDGTIEVKEILEGDEGFDEKKWYEYTAQTGNTQQGGTSKWANAVTFDGEGNIDAYWVWIPRYAYRIIYFDTQEHENAYRQNGTTEGIVGYSDSRGFVHPDGTTPSDMEEPVTSIAVGENMLRPHPAFEDGSKTGYTQGEWTDILEGIWIAKYETSGTGDSLKVLPGVQSLRSVSIGDMYTYAINYNKAKKSHMLKNSEWGAVAYFTESKYGRNGTVVSSNSTGYYTAGEDGATVASNPLQSTTGNYYGIYDTVGGAYEYVAGYIADCSSNYGNSFTSTDNTYNNKTTSTAYATVYNFETVNVTPAENYIKNVNQKFGDATIETSISGTRKTSWNSSYSTFVGFNGNNYYPFFLRGGHYSITDVDLFFFDYYAGNATSYCSFHLCVL